MAAGRKGQAGTGRARQGWAGMGTHLGRLCGAVGTEEALEGDAGVVGGASCGQGGGVSGGTQGRPGGGPGADSPGGLSAGPLGTRFSAGFRGLRGGSAGGGTRGGLRADLRGDGVVGDGSRGHPGRASPKAAALLTWKRMLASESRCPSSASIFCRRAWSRRWGLSWWLSRAPTCARSMEPSRIMDSAGGSEGPRWLLKPPLPSPRCHASTPHG